MVVITEKNNEIINPSNNIITLDDSPSKTNLNLEIEDSRRGVATTFASTLSTSENSLEILHTNQNFQEYSEDSSAPENIENFENIASLKVDIINILSNYERLRGLYFPVLTLNPQLPKLEIQSKPLITAANSVSIKNGEIITATSTEDALSVDLDYVQDKVLKSGRKSIIVSILKKSYSDKADFLEKLLDLEDQLTEENQKIIISFLNDDYKPFNKKQRKIRMKKFCRGLRYMCLSKCCKKK